MENLKQIFMKLQQTSGRKDKENILREQQENETFKKVIYFLLNSYIVTGLSKKKINKNIGVIPNIDYSSLLNLGSYKDKTEGLLNLLKYLEDNNTGRDIDISVCEMYFTNFDKDMQEFIKSIITKSIKLGIDAKTVNKVYGKGFIPTFDCMLAEKYFENLDKVNNKEFTITLKIDGQRCLCIKENNEVSLFSRQGKLIEGLVDIENEVMNIPADNFVLDGELMLLDGNNLQSKEQYKQTLKITTKDGEKHGIKLLTFDLLNLEEFRNQECNCTYSERRKRLGRLDSDISMKYIEILPVLYCGNDISQIQRLLDIVREQDEEGIMININDAPYEFKRTTNLLKVKVMQDCDLKIIGFEEGDGRNCGTLGRLNVDYKGNTLGVGSGFTDSDRDYFWKHQEELMGRVVTVQYFEETENKDKKKSLRFPVFKELREIGKEVSYS